MAVGEYVSTSACSAPSRNTCAIPVCGPRKPTQLTDVPTKLTVTPDPAVVAVAAVPPLQAWLVSPCVHPVVWLTEGEVWSTRVPVAGGGEGGAPANASTTT